MNASKFEVLFVRHPGNPILSAADWPYPVHSVFNPGATLLPDGRTLLLCRVEDRRGFSHLSAARSVNGVDNWEIDPSPTFVPDPENYHEELWGIEDPRITFVPELEAYVIAFTAFGKSGPGVSLALTTDFKSFERLGLVMQPDDKDAALLPIRFNGEYALIHRPSNEITANINISFSPDLRNWGGHALMLPARLGAWWDARKVGLSPPPLETDDGWLVMYHGVRTHASGSIYRLGLALFDKANPSVCLRRGEEWMFGPEESYELVGDVSSVVFPCGWVVLPDGDTVRMYYGAADSSIAMATGSIRAMLNWLELHGSELTGVAGIPTEQVVLSTE